MAARKKPPGDDPVDIEKLLDPTSAKDRAKTVARYYRALGLQVLEVQEVQIGEEAKDTDPVILNGGYVVADDGEAQVPGAEQKVRSYRQHMRKLRGGMAAYRTQHGENWTLITEQIEELKRQDG